MDRELAKWIAKNGIDTEVRDNELVAWIPPDCLEEFYDVVINGGDPMGIEGTIVQGGEVYVVLSDL